MKHLLIKIGKAWGAIQREGLSQGGRRVARAFLSQFHRVKPGEILFIASGVGDSARYRTWHVAEELNLHGFKASVTLPDNPFLLSYVDQFQIFVFHRVLETTPIQKFIDRLKEQKKEIIFETDDLVFDPKYLFHMEYFQKLNPLERELYKDGVGGRLLKDPYVTVATTTTSFLAEMLRARGKRVLLVPNRLSVEDTQLSQDILNAQKEESERVHIGYFSGTPTHSEDFATITPVLLELLHKHAHVRLVIAGMLELGSEFEKVREQVERLPFASRRKHFENLARMDINLAPLVTGDPYREAKSELKFFEAGIVGVPTIASATKTFQEAIRDGVDGYVANTPGEWQEKLEKLILDQSFRKSMGEQARAITLKRYTNQNAANEEYYNYLRSKLV